MASVYGKNDSVDCDKLIHNKSKKTRFDDINLNNIKINNLPQKLKNMSVACDDSNPIMDSPPLHEFSQETTSKKTGFAEKAHSYISSSHDILNSSLLFPNKPKETFHAYSNTISKDILEKK